MERKPILTAFHISVERTRAPRRREIHSFEHHHHSIGDNNENSFAVRLYKDMHVEIENRIDSIAKRTTQHHLEEI